MKQLPQCWSLGVITIGVTTAVIGLQLTGVLQLFEWEVLNQWFRWRPPEPRTVPIVLVTIDDADLQWAGRWPLKDEQLAKLLQRLHRDRPAAIALDLYRDVPVEPGQAELLAAFKTIPNVIGISKAIGNMEGAVVSPPPILRDRDQFGVNDLLLDADGKVRRNLLAIEQQGQDKLALGTKLALIYLSQQGITPSGGVAGDCTNLGKARFCRLEPNAGGYVRVDTRGNQTLSNFLRIPGGIPAVSLKQIMTNQVPATAIQGKIVLVGVKLDSVWGDRFYTPYSTDIANTWAGVEIHANVAAQLITSALDGRPLLQGLPEPWEWGWILLWAGVGTGLGWSLRSLQRAIILIPGAAVGVFASAYGALLLGWWVVSGSPVLALISSALLSRSYWSWQKLKQANQILEQKVQERTQELMEKNLALEQAQYRSERLLLNILPFEIAERLKHDTSPIAEQFDEVTILFADIVGFTPLSTRIKPTELVNLLNEIFSTFDELTEKHGLEKIKTIGDAYMVVGGLPAPRPDHAAAVAQMALDMQATISQFQPSYSDQLQIRIGINTGTVVAGVIGVKKFIYDLWGDAVNVASRMESSGDPGKIQVTEETYAQLKEHYQFVRRGQVAVKGRGEMTTYWLECRNLGNSVHSPGIREL